MFVGRRGEPLFHDRDEGHDPPVKSSSRTDGHWELGAYLTTRGAKTRSVNPGLSIL
jgi:hypothetical protein